MKSSINLIEILGLLFIFLVGWGMADVIKNEIKKYESNLGKKVILEKDTLKVIDYSIIHQNYILSNDKKISFALIDSLEVVK